jgi:arylsulfatase A-like enzyme
VSGGCLRFAGASTSWRVGSSTPTSPSARSPSWNGRPAGKPFFEYVCLTQPHLPTEPNPAFKGKTGNGDWAGMLGEMGANVGQMLDAVDKLGIRDNTMVIFASDNGAEFIKPWDGWSGPWRGAYFTALEGGIRVPFLVRWPGKVPASSPTSAPTRSGMPRTRTSASP